MQQKADLLLEEISRLLAKISRAGEGNDCKSQAVSLLLICHQFLAEYRDDGLGPYEMPENAFSHYIGSDRISLKHALDDAANMIEVSRLPRMQSSESEFYALLV